MAVKPTTATQRASARSIRSLALRESIDLLLLIVAALLMPLLLWLPWPLLRVPFGLAAALLAPGYALVAALFPQRDDLDGVARAALSFGLSVAVLPLLALALDALPWGLRPWPIAATLALWIVFWSVAALLRRALLPASLAEVPQGPNLVGWWSGLNAGARLRAGLGALGLLVVLAAGAYALAVPDPSARLTEFYALGAAGMAEDYPREVAPGEMMQLQLGIANHEGTPGHYRIEARAAGQLLAQAGPIELADGARWEQPLRYALPHPGNDQQVEILLFRDNSATPYRTLRLWVNVRGLP